MVRQRRVNISHEFTTGMAGVINQFTHQQNAALEEQKAKYHKYIRRLERELAEESSIVARQMAELDGQVKFINGIQESKEDLERQLLEVGVKLESSEDRTRKLEEKYHACKTHLNSAIQEQQSLYTFSKQHCDEALNQMRALDKSRSTEAEMAVRKAEIIREEMMEKVRQVISENKAEALERKFQTARSTRVDTDSLPSVRQDKLPDAPG
jgi:hypothetical protein